MTDESLISVTNLVKKFSVREDSFFQNLLGDQRYLNAVDDISFDIDKGEIVGLAGQSGCGKSTLGELLLNLQKPTSGSITYRGKDLSEMNKEQLKKFRRNAQIVFQDPYESLNPRHSVGRIIGEPLKIHGLGDVEDRDKRIREALRDSGLGPPEKFIPKLPSELSGGERQRVAIARALVLDPDFIIADEPVSMLDVSVSTGILNLFRRLKESRDLTLIYISHDLATIDYLTDRTMIMYLGKVVEDGPTDLVIGDPAHPYTEQLLAAVPNPDPDVERIGSSLAGQLEDSVDLPDGCRFEPKCQYATDKCRESEPPLEKLGNGRSTACYHPVSETDSPSEPTVSTQ